MTILLDGTLGITTPGLTNTGTETIVDLTTTGNTTLGDATTDTLTVGVTGIVKDASGNVGIGTTSATTIGTANGWPGLVVGSGTGAWGATIYSGSASNGGLAFANGTTTTATYNGYVSYNHNTNAMTFATNAGTERMRIDSSGNVGIGNTTPSSFDATGKPLVVGSGSGNQGMTLYAGTSSSASINFAKSTSGSDRYIGQIEYAMGDNSMRLYTNATERMRIDSSGFTYINCTSSVGSVSAYSNILFSGLSYFGIAIKTSYASAGSTFAAFINSAGTTQGSIYANATNTVQFLTSSDYRLKENIAPMTGALAKVSALKPVTYNWKSDGSASQGFIAHELAEVSPECVGGEKDAVDANGNPKYQGVDTSFLVATLTAAIQEQQALIQSLTTRLTALENK